MSDETPLSEAQPTSLDEHFNRDPNEPDFDKSVEIIVEELRKKREVWAQAEAEGKTRAPTKKAPKQSAPADLDLSKLGL